MLVLVIGSLPVCPRSQRGKDVVCWNVVCFRNGVLFFIDHQMGALTNEGGLLVNVVWRSMVIFSHQYTFLQHTRHVWSNDKRQSSNRLFEKSLFVHSSSSTFHIFPPLSNLSIYSLAHPSQHKTHKQTGLSGRKNDGLMFLIPFPETRPYLPYNLLFETVYIS